MQASNQKSRATPLNLDLALTNDQVFEFIQNKPAIQPLAQQMQESRPTVGSSLTSQHNAFMDQSNLKSPVFAKLETMIQTLNMFRQEMDGQRIPKFEENFLKRKLELDERRAREMRRRERKLAFGMLRQLDDPSRHQTSFIQRKTHSLAQDSRNLGPNRHLSTRKIFNSYRINDYSVSVSPSPTSKHSIAQRVTFEGQSPRKTSVHQQSSMQSLSKRDKEHMNSERSISAKGNTSAHKRRESVRAAPSFKFGKHLGVVRQQTISPTAAEIREIEIMGDSICEDSTSQGVMKLRPGETKGQALERIKRYKEIKRIEKLMRFAYPRQREEYIMKKRVLGPEQLNTSVDFIRLKQESLRIDNDRSQIRNYDSCQEDGSLMLVGIESSHFSQAGKNRNVNIQDGRKQAQQFALNSVSTLPAGQNSDLVPVDSSHEIQSGNPHRRAGNNPSHQRSDDSLMQPMPLTAEDVMKLPENSLPMKSAAITRKHSMNSVEATEMIMEVSCNDLSTPLGISQPPRPPQTTNGCISPRKAQAVAANQRKVSQPADNMRRHRDLQPIEMLAADPMMTTNATSFPQTAKNKQMISVSSARQQTPIQHKVLEEKIMRKKKRSIKEAMQLQNNIATLMGNLQETLQAERRNHFLSPLSVGSINNSREQHPASEVMYKSVNYGASKPKTIAASHRSSKLQGMHHVPSDSKRDALTEATLKRNLKQAQTSQNSRMRKNSTAENRGSYQVQIVAPGDGAMSIRDATTTEGDEDRGSFILFQSRTADSRGQGGRNGQHQRATTYDKGFNAKKQKLQQQQAKPYAIHGRNLRVQEATSGGCLPDIAKSSGSTANRYHSKHQSQQVIKTRLVNSKNFQQQQQSPRFSLQQQPQPQLSGGRLNLKPMQRDE